MNKKRVKILNQSAFLNMSRQLCFCFLLVAVHGCVTTGSQPVRPVTTSNCAGQAGGGAANQAGAAESKPNNGNCGPKGVIEISENYTVDPEVRAEFHQAIALLDQEKYEDAIRLLKAVTGKASKFTSPYINLGIAYQRINDFEKAEEALKKAVEINPVHPVANNELGLVYRKTGRYAEARTLYENLLAQYPDFEPAYKNLGVLCDIYIQDLDCALNAYQHYLKAVPGDEKVQIWVADVKSRM